MSEYMSDECDNGNHETCGMCGCSCHRKAPPVKFLYIGPYRDMRAWAREHKVPEKHIIHGSKGGFGMRGINTFVHIIRENNGRELTSQEIDAINIAHRLQRIYPEQGGGRP